jgi:hypothetical protein
MGKWNVLLPAVMVGLISIVSTGCAPKTKEALRDAEAAIAEAEQSSASVKSPEIYEQAKQHLSKGREYEAYFRNELARVEYEAAAADARLAVALSGEEAPRGPECPECAPCPVDTEAGACCLELGQCNSRQNDLEDKLDRCRAGGFVRTRVIREPCVREEAPAPSAAMQALIGTLLIEPPQMITKGKEDYKIKVRYVRAALGAPGGARAESDYRILLDIADVDPPQVEVFSPTADYEPLTAHGGEWSLPMTVPKGTSVPVKVKIAAMLTNYATGAEQTLPEYTVMIPNAAACPECPKLPKAAAPKVEEAGPGWVTRILFLIIGLGAGIVGGYFLFRGKGSSTIKL